MRLIRSISERDIATALVLHYVETKSISFSLMGFYDDDIDFLQELAARLDVAYDGAFIRKLRRVVQRLVRYGVMYSRMRGTAKEYVDEPAKQMNYYLKPGKEHLIDQPYRPGVTLGPMGEIEFLLRHAYPRPDAQPSKSGD